MYNLMSCELDNRANSNNFNNWFRTSFDVINIHFKNTSLQSVSRHLIGVFYIKFDAESENEIENILSRTVFHILLI